MNETSHINAFAPGVKPLSPEDRAGCAAMAALLHATADAPRFGWRVLLAGAAWLMLGAALVRGPRLWPAPILGACTAGLLVGAGLLGLLLRACLFRVRFDARLFDALAQGHIATLTALDAAVALTTSRRVATSAPLDLAQRIQRTRALLRRGALVTLAQTAALALAFVLSLFLLRGLAP